jgi:hypothetical protein
MSGPPCKSITQGYALGRAPLGGKHPHAKPWKGEGGCVFEIVEDHRGRTYPTVYTDPTKGKRATSLAKENHNGE